MGLGKEICFQLAKKMVANRQFGKAGANIATFDTDSYEQWRSSELAKQFSGFLSATDIAGYDVLDFGCGAGELSFYVAQLGAKSITGTDLSEQQVYAARKRVKSLQLSVKPEFLLAQDAQKIPLPNDSIDIILCFDVMEHVMEYDAVIAEWRRVLRIGGRVAIWWVPWWHPYGPHIESLVPIPWAHVFFSEKVLLDTCARIYDMPSFTPRIWDQDESGNKKPNKWRTMTKLPEVNHLTMRKFEQRCRRLGFLIRERKLSGFGSSNIAKLTHPFLRVPFMREFFTSSAIYQLLKT